MIHHARDFTEEMSNSASKKFQRGFIPVTPPLRHPVSVSSPVPPIRLLQTQYRQRLTRNAAMAIA